MDENQGVTSDGDPCLSDEPIVNRANPEVVSAEYEDHIFLTRDRSDVELCTLPETLAVTMDATAEDNQGERSMDRLTA